MRAGQIVLDARSTGDGISASTTCSPACAPHAAAEGRPGNPNRGVAASTGRGAAPGPDLAAEPSEPPVWPATWVGM